MLNTRILLALLLLAFALPASLFAQDAPKTAESSALIAESAKLRREIDESAKELFTLLESAYAMRAALPLAPKSVEALDLNVTLQMLDSYSEFKKHLIEAYDAISHEPENPQAESSLFALVIRHQRVAARIGELPSTSESLAELESSKSISERFDWSKNHPSALGVHLYGRAGLSSRPHVDNAIILPQSIELNMQVQQTRHPRSLSFAVQVDSRLLVSIQLMIDPIEEIIFELEEHKFELEEAEFAALESQGKAPEEEINEELPAHRRSEIRITRYRNYREKTLGEFEDSYFRMMLKASRLDEDIQIDTLIEEGLEVGTKARKSLEERASQVESEVGNKEAENLLQTLAMLESTLKTMREEESAIPNGIERDLARSLVEARNERLRALRAEIRRQRSRYLVRRKAAQRQIASIVTIDERLANLEKRYFDERLKFFGFAALWALTILFGAWLLIRVVKMIAKRIVKRFNAELDHIDQDTEARARTISVAFTGTLSAAIWVVAFLMIMGHFGVNYQPLLVATGGVGLAVGFGAQSLVKDFFSGFFILLENQFTVGDVITIDGKTGTVDEINLRTTRMRSLDGTYHTVPNGQIASVSNMTHKWSRMLVVIGAGYREDPDQVRAIINRVGAKMYEDEAWANRLLEPPVVLGLDNLNASSIDFKIVGRTRSGEQWAAEREFRRRVKIEFDLEDIEIPFQYVNYVETAPEKSRVLKSPSPTMRKKMIEAEETEVWDEGGAKREKERARESDESEQVELGEADKKPDEKS